MTRDQAEEIHRHLLDAASAMSRAEAAMGELGGDDRKALAEPLVDVSINLHSGLLRTIYKQFPDLEPPRNDVPTIDSELRWDEVTLPPAVAVHDLDEMIFSLLKPRWQKMAMLLVCAHEHCEQRSWPIEADVVAARVHALAEAGRIDHHGDLRKWRFSEIRLKPQLKLLP
jgi:hypothetical protein